MFKRMTLVAAICAGTALLGSVADAAPVAAAASGTTVTITTAGVRAAFPSGWRKCGFGLVERTARCTSPIPDATPRAALGVQPWHSRWPGDTCIDQNFPHETPGPRITVPAAVRRAWLQRGWYAPTANRTVFADPAGGGDTLFYLVCARTHDRRWVQVSVSGLRSRGSAVLTKALWTAAGTLRIRPVPVYLPGALRRIEPRRAQWSGDGTLLLRRLTWSHWTTRTAVGRGIEAINDCSPSCGAGHYASYPVTLRASVPQYLRCGMFFRKVAVHYRSQVPPGGRRDWTFVVDARDDAFMLHVIGSCPS